MSAQSKRRRANTGDSPTQSLSMNLLRCLKQEMIGNIVKSEQRFIISLNRLQKFTQRVTFLELCKSDCASDRLSTGVYEIRAQSHTHAYLPSIRRKKAIEAMNPEHTMEFRSFNYTQIKDKQIFRKMPKIKELLDEENTKKNMLNKGWYSKTNLLF